MAEVRASTAAVNAYSEAISILYQLPHSAFTLSWRYTEDQWQPQPHFRAS